MATIEELRAELEDVLARLHVSENKLDVLERIQTSDEDTARNIPEQTRQYADITTRIDTGELIQLESYRSIPEFNGDKKQYQSWRSQVTRRMQMIDHLKEHPKYEAALGIIRAKITGAASDALTNNNTAYNIEAIIARLDASYADQRPLYVVEADMTSIRQNEKSLQDYHDAINQALNLVISKIKLTYKIMEEQRALISQAQIKAIRTFIIGLKYQNLRNILYGGKYKTLADVYTSAQTVYYDNQYLQLDQNREVRGGKQNPPRKFYSGMQQQNLPPKFNVNVSCNQPTQKLSQQVNNPEPMDIDSSNRFKQSTNWRQPNQPMNRPTKREYNSACQQTPNKFQRINQLDGETNPDDGYEGDICDDIPDELISHESFESDNASAFLSE